MLELGAIGFTAPWALGALALAPILWLLLRLLPPAPRHQSFPPLVLLAALGSAEDSTARTPWWMLALRLLAVILLVAAAAGPVAHPRAHHANSPLVLVIDDGWAAAADWRDRQAFAQSVLRHADRLGRPVRLVATAPPFLSDDWLTATEALARLAALEPKPWPTGRSEVRKAVAAWPRDTVTEVVWLTDGLEDGAGQELMRELQTLGGGVELVFGRAALLLSPPEESGAADRLTARLVRAQAPPEPERIAVRASDPAGRVLARAETELPAGRTEARIEIRLPADLRNQVVRLDIDGMMGAGTSALLDERWRRRPVGLAALDEAAVPLLAPLYYLDRALAPFADLHHGEVGSLMDRGVAMLVLADLPPPSASMTRRLTEWVEAGGVLVRFAGPETARAISGRTTPDPLAPVALRTGGRSLGGAMSWTNPQGLAAFPDHGPFAGLTADPDIRVASQVLAEPVPDLAERTWASLTDGTPLVTGRRQGKGWLVLIHTTANAEWSNLPLSGLFVEMTRRLTQLSTGLVADRPAGPAMPIETLDGFGRLTPPGPLVVARPEGAPVGPRHPPGFYGSGPWRQAVNLAPLIGPLRPLAAVPGVKSTALSGQKPGERDLRGPLLLAAGLLVLLDLMVSLGLRGLLTRAALAALALTAAALPAHAADPAPPEAALSTRLAWVRTHDGETDRKSAAGLKALSKLVGQRSTARLAAPVGIDLEADPVHLYPLIYWPVGVAQKPPSPAAIARLTAYLRAGGMIVLDSAGDGANAGGEADSARALTADLALPGLVPVGPDHVLTRSFYLLRELPGRWNGPAWAADPRAGGQDGVSPVVAGANDWAGAWATDERDRPLYACVPGGERQREMALRFGVNLVMYALTGNYKADQVHLPAILERLGR
ncbi:N-terminal double-transmembrane domain protein [Magnetospirillum sp. LM-5]|uniref:DUF4159 domain-containing protein n=1 Tax=Magnetospirillum sp. LM-5 TaxID=2681466 RepID=UPI00137D53A3|nr:DUF4159 domain-containing protein [Magnetospirillum sp. LM-5]CAA7619461.1 N-terminal double-transmembrane domain protein [Magnetospirillum sp. LM-5]